MATVTLNNVVKRYGQLEVVHSIDLSVKDREFVALVGPSGCGKSTTLRMIAGLEEISGGEIAIGDTVVNDLSPRERNIAMVFQSYALYPHMTVRDNMAFALKMAGMSKAEQDERVANAAKILELEPLLQRRPAQLSGGQRQRVAMGRAIVRDPAVFLFDEPLSNLDAKLRTQVRSQIKRLHQRLQATIIYVTHDQVEAMTLADRVVIMRDGFIEQVGTPDEVFHQPASLFVAGFIGSPPMNLIDATFTKGALDLGNGVVVPLPPAYAGRVADGDKVVFGLRPDDLFIDGHGVHGVGAGTAHQRTLKVSLAEPLGNETLVFVDFAGKEWVLRMLNPRPVTPGEDISVMFDLSKAHLFAPDTGKRLA
ncbi:sn-glycerol-3-phosphate ABC transporter ATP-binding protein UgpC [Devosia sp.]|uniref:ABC transporter ATP-binding protein n=1 Tax=Devosia sp. TaxID=1871048 RepID=UPI0032641E16